MMLIGMDFGTDAGSGVGIVVKHGDGLTFECWMLHVETIPLQTAPTTFWFDDLKIETIPILAVSKDVNSYPAAWLREWRPRWCRIDQALPAGMQHRARARLLQPSRADRRRMKRKRWLQALKATP